MKQYAVVGHPLEHSLSPALFSAEFKQLCLDSSYVKEDVLTSELSAVIKKVRQDVYAGLSITVPYKTDVLQYLDRLSPEAMAIGAVNCVYKQDGVVYGENTDWVGFKKALAEHTDLKGKSVLIYGAGGAARACLFALSDFKKNVSLTNRSKDKGVRLAEEYGVKFVEKTKLQNCDIFINATSSGLATNVEPVISEADLANTTLVFDLLYGETLLTKTAHKLGIETVDGKKMLLYQAERQFELFTGQKAPIEAMGKALSL